MTEHERSVIHKMWCIQYSNYTRFDLILLGPAVGQELLSLLYLSVCLI